MAILFNVQNITLAYGARPLFTNISFALNSGERVGLIGPNGAGKSSLLKIIAGSVKPDSGVLSMQKGLRVGLLAQVPTFTAGKTVLETVLEGASDPDDWEAMAKAQELLAKLSLADAGGPERNVEELSGGWKKRVALARELLREPDLLLLDEPTNHLDLESILWLEDFLARSPFATLTITHDRAFLQKVSNRILDLDRRNPGGIFSVNGDYLTYVQAKEDMLNAQHRQETRLRNTLRRETEWLRRGPKARTTKQTARIDRAGDLMDAVDELAYRNQNNKVRLDFQALDKSPKKLVEAKGISKSYNGVSVLPKMDFLVSASSRIGLLGRNGSGKSTLMRILLKEEQPDTGTVVMADALQPIYFEQNRESLDPELTVLKTLCPSGDHVDFQGRQVHVKGYLDRFLFTPAQMEMAVGNLSGGEQSRLLLARLMLRKGNLLLLDEPTNDLDLETLDVLQDVLQEFKGAVLLVTHDRYFMDQVTSQIFAFTDGDKKEVVPFAGVGQWEDWVRSRGSKAKSAAVAAAKTESATAKGKKKLSYKEQRELDGMESRIHEAEDKLRQLEEESHKPEVAANAGRILEITQEMAKKQAEIDGLYARWSELEG